MLNTFNPYLIQSFIESQGPFILDTGFDKPIAWPEGMIPEVQKLLAKYQDYSNPSSEFERQSCTEKRPLSDFH